jgi:cbb3-type cytochrome oxidase maturation protein
MTEQILWILLPVSLVCGIIAACLFWRWDISGFRTDAERKANRLLWERKAEEARRILKERKETK